MESKDELKETDIKNRTCYYFYDVMRVIDVNFITVSYKTLMGTKPLRIKFGDCFLVY